MTDITKHYAPLFKGWQAKVLGPKPSDELLTLAHDFGRPGKQSLALAMALRPEGVSGAQVVMACGAPQNNHRTGLVRAGFFKRDMSATDNDQGHTVYRINLTAKGEAARKRRAEAAAKASLETGDKPAKPRKAKAKRATKPAKPEAKPVDVQPAATPEAPAATAEA